MRFASFSEYPQLRELYSTLTSLDPSYFINPIFDILCFFIHILLLLSSKLTNSTQTPQNLYKNYQYKSKVILCKFETLTEAQQISKHLNIPLMAIFLNNSNIETRQATKVYDIDSKMEQLLIRSQVADYLNSYFIVWLGVRQSLSNPDGQIQVVFYKETSPLKKIKSNEFVCMDHQNLLEDELQKIRDQFYSFSSKGQQEPVEVSSKADTLQTEEEIEESDQSKQGNVQQFGYLKFDKLRRLLHGLEQEDDDDETMTQQESQDTNQ